MLSSKFIINKSMNQLTKYVTNFRSSHKFSRRCLVKQSPSNKHQVFNTRYTSSGAGVKKNFPLIAAISAVGGAAITYVVFKFYQKKPEIDENVDELIDKPYVHERLDEDLALLAEYGPIPYLLVGAGPASFSAFKAIRVADPTSKILMIGDEPHFPYFRPPLSKDMWYDEKADPKNMTFESYGGHEQSVYYLNDNYYFSVQELLESKNGGISVIRSKKVVKVDPVNQIVHLDQGEKIAYKKCLLATGSKHKNLPVFENADESIRKHVTLFRTIRDYQRLDKVVRKSKSIVVVGGGFLGSELASGITKKGQPLGVEVTQILPERGLLAKIIPEYLSVWATKKLSSEGVKIIPEVEVKSVSKEGDELVLHLSNNDRLKTNHVVVAVGADADTDLAKTSGLEVDPVIGGFLVNTELQARKNLYVAGDAASFYDMKLGRRRIEHHYQALVSGKLAGKNMAGKTEPYSHQAMFWSDLGVNIGAEGVGITDSTLPTVSVFCKSNADDSTPEISENKTSLEDYNKGLVFYLRDNIIVGILCWNVFRKLEEARQIINESRSSDDIPELAKLFELGPSPV